MQNDEIRQALEQCRRGDIRGLRELFARHGDRVFRICRNLLGQTADAEDAVHDVFLRVFAKAGSFDGRSRFTTWLYRMTVNHCLNLRKRNDRSEPLAGTDHIAAPARDAPDELLARAEAPRQLDRLLARLSQGERAVVTLREIEELSYQEIAEVLAIPLGTVMSRLSRARVRLQGFVARNDPGVLHR